MDKSALFVVQHKFLLYVVSIIWDVFLTWENMILLRIRTYEKIENMQDL